MRSGNHAVDIQLRAQFRIPTGFPFEDVRDGLPETSHHKPGAKIVKNREKRSPGRILPLIFYVDVEAFVDQIPDED